VAPRNLAGRLARRALLTGVPLGPDVAEGAEAYLDLLAKWNRRINLTSLKLEPMSDEAIDRLVLEPVVAVRHVRPTDRIGIDIGSGGGSPGLIFGLIARKTVMVLVESKTRKSAFLREAGRALGLSNVEVANVRFEELLARPDLHESTDFVTLRAVRPDRRVWASLDAFLRPGGRLLWFVAEGQRAEVPVPFRLAGEERLVSSTRSSLAIVEKRGLR
jgi:16S rRNA (guanine527-N7)-methyltransferase